MNEIEKIAEVLFNKGFSEDKNKCLEAATELKKMQKHTLYLKFYQKKRLNNI